MPIKTYAASYVITGRDPEYAEDRCRHDAIRKIATALITHYDLTEPVTIRLKEDRVDINDFGKKEATEVRLSLDICPVQRMEVASYTPSFEEYTSPLWRIVVDRTKIKWRGFVRWITGKD